MKTSHLQFDLNRSAVTFVACLAGALHGASGQAADAPVTPKVVHAVRTETVPIIDGDLGDPVWQQAAIVEDFHEIIPNEFSDPSEQTRIYVLYGKDALYIAARYQDSDPDKVSAQVLRQGDHSPGDDGISIILDPFNNGRSGYIFRLNPNGIRTEAVYENVTEENWAWQGIWHAAANKNEEGWVAEFEIPFKSLSFDPQNETWGINFSRRIGRRSERIGWVSYNRLQNPANSGKLTGLQGIEQGRGLDIVPGIRLSDSKDYNDSALSGSEFEPSLDVFYKPTPSLTAALTLNTDFSGTGVDVRQINLTQFGLFFPERRNFFLQDTDIFEFGRIGASSQGIGQTAAAGRESGRPFFSRRIGLRGGGEGIGLEVGAKVTGRIGRWDIGILDIQQDAYADVDSTNLFVGRVAANVLDESSVGVIVTNGDPSHNSDNSLAGVDFRYLNTRLASGRTINGALWYQQTETDGLNGDDAAFGFSLITPNSEGFKGAIFFKEIQENFNPALGFVSRDGVQDMSVEMGHTWRPDDGKLRSVSSSVSYQRIEKLGGELDTEKITLNALNLENHSSDRAGIRYMITEERVVDPFEISAGVTIPPGLYSWGRTCVSGGTGQHRVLQTGSFVCFGDFYDGSRTTVSANVTWRPSPHFRLSLGYSMNDVDLPYGEFITRLATLRADIVFTSTWYWENFVQYDNVSDSLGVSSIMRWIPRAGREMVLVINRKFLDANETRDFKSVSSDLALKVSYTFRF